MRLREAVWRTVGPPLGRVAPGPARAYYTTLTGSLVRSLLRDPAVLAVYAHGSYALGELRPGHSDVDLVAVVEDMSVEDELAALRRLRRVFTRRQALLPIDLTVVTRASFRCAAPWHAFLRMRIGEPRPVCAVSEWLLLGGAELREGVDDLDPRLAYLTESHLLVAFACAARGDGAALRRQLGKLDRDARREQLAWPAALALHDALRRHADAEAVVAALNVIDEHRRRNVVPRNAVPDARRWAAQPAAAASAELQTLATAAPARSATLYLPPFASTPVLLLEAPAVEAADALVRYAFARASEAARLGADLQVLTSRLAEDSWRSGLRAVPLLAAAQHLAGEPLAPRLGFPAAEHTRTLALGRAITAVAFLRWWLLGLRRHASDDTLPFVLEACHGILAGEPPATDRRVLAERNPELARLAERVDDTAFAELTLRIWRRIAGLVDEDDPFGAQALTVERAVQAG